MKGSQPTSPIISKVRKSFDLFTKRPGFGHSDKIVKRFIGFASKSKSDYALDYVLSGLSSDPGMRGYAYWYLSALPPNDKALSAIEKYLRSPAALDDASQCQLAKLLTDWEIDPADRLFSRLQGLADDMGQESYVGTHTYRFVGALWMLTKYATQSRIADFVEQSKPIWQHSEFLARQVAAASGKFRDQSLLSSFSKGVRAHGMRSSISVLDALDYLRSFERAVPSDVRLYILNGKNSTTYTLQRFLVAFTVLNSKPLRRSVRDNLRNDLLSYLRDPHYRDVIQKIP